MKLPSLRWDLSIYNLFMVVAAVSAFYAVTNARLDAADRRADKYVPVIEELQRNAVAQIGRDRAQDARVEALIDGFKDVRRTLGEQASAQANTNEKLVTQLTDIRNTLTWFRATVEASGGKPPPTPRMP